MGRAADLVSQGYTGYQGWGDAEANADFNATGGSGKRPAVSSPSVSSNPQTIDPVAEAQKIRDFNIQSNQPAIASLTASKAPLEQRYADLVTNIKGNQTTANNQQTVATASELGRRGIVGGGLYDQSLTNALAPIGVQYSGLLSQANTGQQQDEATINNQIASLQSGNPEAAVASALQYGGLQQSAQSLAAQIAQNQIQNQLAQQGQTFNQKYIPVQGMGIYDVQGGKFINQLNGGSGAGGIQIINGIPYINQT